MSFLFPAGLALSSLAIPLVALYFLRMRRRRVVVPSLLPWARVARAERLASPFHRFRRHLLLLLQLLALLACVLAWARPYVETDAVGYQSVVLVVDTSASMGATDVAPSRLGAAVAEASAIVDRLGPTDEVMVVAAGPRTAVAAPFTRDHAAAVRTLADLAPTEAEGGLEDGLALAASLVASRPDVQIVVLSDGGPRPLAAIGGAPVRFVPIGVSDANVGIVAVDLRRSPVSELDQQLFVTAASFGAAPVDATVEVYLDERLIGLRNARLERGAPAPMVFDLPADSAGVLRAEVHAEPDHLAADDVVYARLEPLAGRRVLLVGGDALLVRILASDPRVRATRVAPSAVTPEILADADAILFAGAVPDGGANGLDGYDYAVLGPYPGAPVGFGPPVTAPKITGWQRAHPALRFTRWDDVTVAEARRVVDPAGLQAIVDGDAGPLVLAGQRNGGRVVQLAFDPLRTDLPLRVAWPILVMNVVGWLTDDAGGGASAVVRTGQPFTERVAELGAADDTDAVVTGPAPARATVADGVVRVTGLDRVGTYKVRVGSAELAFAANLLSDAESQIRVRSTLEDPGAVPVEAASVATARRELWRELVLVGLAILAVEWLVWAARRDG